MTKEHDIERSTGAGPRPADRPPAHRAADPQRALAGRAPPSFDRIDAMSVLAAHRVVGNRATAALVQRVGKRKRAADAEPASEPPEKKYAPGGDAAARAIIAWIRKNPPGKREQNWSVGVHINGDLYISRAGGLTPGIAYLKRLRRYIKANRFEEGRDIFLANKFNREVTSGNHAEMCVVAAAGENALSTIYCVAPHCAFCAALMEKLSIEAGAPIGGPAQTGWAHPFAPILFGRQQGDPASHLTKLKDLKETKPTKEQAEKAGLKDFWKQSRPRGSKVNWL